LLEGQAQPQANRATVVNPLLGPADVVSPEIRILIHILYYQRASRSETYIEIPYLRKSCVERGKQRMIEYVVKVGTYLEPSGFVKPEVLMNSKVNSPGAGANEKVSLGDSRIVE